MIFTDGIHVISNISLDELHHFAKCLNFKKEWFQNHPRHPHYDLTTTRAKNRAIAQGAKLISSTELIKILRETKK